MVIFWSPARLAAALRTQTLREVDKLHLLVATLVLEGVFGSLGILYAWRSGALLVAAIFGLSVSLIGLYSSFRANQRGDQVHFVERLVCLGFPVSARVLPAFYGGYWILAIVTGHSSPDDGMTAWAQWLLVYLLATAVHWGIVRRYVAIAARPTIV